MKTENLLIELLVEELPPKALKKLGVVFAQSIEKHLKEQGLLQLKSQAKGFATPRRLGVLITDVLEQAPEQQIKQKIMPVSVGLDAEGEATQALQKKLLAMGLGDLKVSSLTREMDGKAEALYYDRMQAGVSLERGLQHALNSVLGELPIPKMMSYQLQTGCEMPGWSTVHFVRPAHSLLALHGKRVVNVQLLGLQSGNTTQGHRFESKQERITLSDASEYERIMLSEGGVIPSFEDRRKSIKEQLFGAAKKLGPNYHPLEDEALLDEVCALVEKPNVLTCKFESDFLEVPQECLILTMKANQKYFPLLDKDNKLTNHFLVVSNISPTDTSAVVGGNERVVRPRLADAKFFFDQDKKKTLESRVLGLSKVVYHNLLGSQGERVQRVCEIVGVLVQMWSKSSKGAMNSKSNPGTDDGADQLLKNAQLAARLAKADLLTDMVSEFPELQGTMGKYYALYEGLSEEVAFAIEDHYKPRFAGDELARSTAGLMVAMADKLETLIGLFGIGQGPSGDKDPFALRRHALGLIRMLIERDLMIEITPLLTQVCAVFGDRLKAPAHEVVEQVKGFIYDRLSSNLKEMGYSVKEIDAVICQKPELLCDVPLRVKAVNTFSALSEAPALAAANKRIGNILKKEGRLGDALTLKQSTVDEALLSSEAEQTLFKTLNEIAPTALANWHKQDYAQALVVLAGLKAPTDAFFEEVMVNDPDERLRENRLALLSSLHREMNRVAELARLAV
jgi:glycyl-tRNA synthetase beta chain